MVDTTINFDDECVICGTKRDEHGDKNHQFSLDGQLIPVRKGPEGVKPPQTREEAVSTPPSDLPDIGRAFATLVEVLAEKNIVDTKDVIRIFSGKG